MNPFLRLIANDRWQDPTVPSWILVLHVHLSITPQGVCVRAEPRRLREGKLQAFPNHVPQFHGLQYRARLSQQPESWTAAAFCMGDPGYYGLDKVCEPALGQIIATTRLFRRRHRSYVRRHGSPNTVGWCVVALAEIFGVNDIHVEEDGHQQFYCGGPSKAARTVDSIIQEMQQVHDLSKSLRAAEEAEAGAGFVQAPTSPTEIAAIRRCLGPELIKDHIRRQLWRELEDPEKSPQGLHPPVGGFGQYELWLIRRPDQWRFSIQWVRNADTDEPVCPVSHRHRGVPATAAPPPAGPGDLLLDGRDLNVLSPDLAARHRAEGLPVLRCYVSEAIPE